MRLPLVILSVALPLISGGSVLSAQQSAPHKKVLTPEQQEFQRKWREYVAKRHDLQAQAKQVFDAEMTREKVDECRDATTTYDINACFGKELGTTDTNLKSYEGIIGELIAPAPEAPGAPTSGPAGASLTPAQSVAEFDHVNQTWAQYRDTACAAAFHYFDGGTGGPSFEMQCRLDLDRDHMRELSLIYGGYLRL